MRDMRVGVVGSGYWGPNVIRNLSEIRGSDLRYVADLHRPRLDEISARYPSVKTTTDYTDLLDAGLDAVAICTPPQTHFQLAKEYLEAGLHVLVEKPLTTSSKDASELIRIAERVDRTLMVGHTFLYNPAVTALKGMLDRGDLGEIRYIDAVRVGLGMYNPVLNVVWDLAPHDISILMYLLEQIPTTVTSAAVACLEESVEDVAYLNLRFPSGVMSHVRASWLDPSKIRRITVIGSERMVIYDDVEPNEKLRVFDKGVEALKTPDSFGEFQFNYRYGDIVSPFIEFHEPLRVQCEHFLDCIRHGMTPLTDGHNGLQVVEVIEALQRSLENAGQQTAVRTSTPTVSTASLNRSSNGAPLSIRRRQEQP